MVSFLKRRTGRASEGHAGVRRVRPARRAALRHVLQTQPKRHEAQEVTRAHEVTRWQGRARARGEAARASFCASRGAPCARAWPRRRPDTRSPPPARRGRAAAPPGGRPALENGAPSLASGFNRKRGVPSFHMAHPPLWFKKGVPRAFL